MIYVFSNLKALRYKNNFKFPVQDWENVPILPAD